MRISTAVLMVALGATGYLHQNTAAQPAAEAGKKSFETRCAPCHGGDGRGGERGPNILVSETVRKRPAAALGELITGGVPAGGMPGVSLPRAELDALVAFVRALAAPARENPPAGNVEAGEAFFFGKGACGSCHCARGRGGIRRPHLSGIGARRPRAGRAPPPPPRPRSSGPRSLDGETGRPTPAGAGETATRRSGRSTRATSGRLHRPGSSRCAMSGAWRSRRWWSATSCT